MNIKYAHICTAALLLTFITTPLYANANIDRALGYGAAVWALDKIFGTGDIKQLPGDGTCMAVADEMNSIPLEALMTARHMTMYACNTEPRSREIVQRLSSAFNIQDLYFMNYAKTLGKYWNLMQKQYDELNAIFDGTSISDRGLTRLEYLEKVIVIVEKASPQEIRITYTFPKELKKTDCCVKNTMSVYLSVSTVDFGAFSHEVNN